MTKKNQAPNNPQLAILLDLMKENPHLPIVPMVNYEVVPDDCAAYWMGSWGRARIDEYVIGNERIYFKGDDDAYDLMLHFEDLDKLDSMTDEEIEAACDALPWKKAIIVYIETPEE